MKILLNKSQIVINKSPEIVWEREGDFEKFSNSEGYLSYYGFCQYTRLMSSDLAFDGVIFGFLKAPSEMDVNYRIFYTSYLKGGTTNDAPELYSYPSASFTEISAGTVHVGTEFSDIVISVPETTVPSGKEVVCMMYGNGTDKLSMKVGGGDSWGTCNSMIYNNHDTMTGSGYWLVSNVVYSGGASMSLRLTKK